MTSVMVAQSGTTSAKSRSPRSYDGTGRNPWPSRSASAPAFPAWTVARTVQPAQRPDAHNHRLSALPIPCRCHASATRIPISASPGVSETKLSRPTGRPPREASSAAPSGGPASRNRWYRWKTSAGRAGPPIMNRRRRLSGEQAATSAATHSRCATSMTVVIAP
jgi:hypothetical protein